MIASMLTIAWLMSPGFGEETTNQSVPIRKNIGVSDIAFAVATDDGVIVRYADGSQKKIDDTIGTRGLALASNKMLYVAGPHALRRIDLQTGRVEILTDGWEMIDTPAVSPDGRSVAFAGYTRTAKWSIYTIAGRNGNPKYIAHGFMPAWEVDGRGLLFENYTDESAQVYRYNPATRDVSKIQYDREGSIKNAVSAALSRDGKWLSFANQGGLFVCEQATLQTRPITDSTHYDSRQVFTADGRQLLFIRRSRDQHGRRVDPRAMRIDLATGHMERVMKGPAHAIAVMPDWRPTPIVFESEMGPPAPGQGDNDC